mmetsp:Transcript_18763/g.27119  ORF Transcript_18763/g.27119 Transcript_18763/m.27119 type:complete len:474 (+) Transcript_18763:778-2199(+)
MRTGSGKKAAAVVEARGAEVRDSRTKLHRLLYHKDFKRALRRIELKRTKKPPREGSVRKQDGRHVVEEEEMKPEVEVFDDMGNLPLHIALASTSRAPFSIVEALVNQYEAAVETPTDTGEDLPLTLACSPKLVLRGQHDCKELAVLAGSDLEKTIFLLMRKYPQAISKQSKEGATALHTLLEHRPQLPLVSEMIRLVDEDIASDKESRTRQRIVDIKDCQGQLPLHVAIQYHAPADVTMYLLKENSGAAKARMNQGYLPLHFAAMWGCAFSVLDELLNSNAFAVKETTLKKCGGDTPLHLVFGESTFEKWHCREGEKPVDPEGVILGIPGGILSPEKIVRHIVFQYYNTLRTQPDTWSRKKKKRSTVCTQQQATKKVKELVGMKNNFGRSVLEQADKVKDFFNVPETLLIFLKQLTNEEFDLESERDRSTAHESANSSSSESSSDSEGSNKETQSGSKRRRVDESKQRSKKGK